MIHMMNIILMILLMLPLVLIVLLFDAIYFPRVIIYTFFSFLLIYGGLVVLGLGFGVFDWGFWGWSFQLMGFGACGVGPVWVFFWGWGSLNKHRRMSLGKKLCIVDTYLLSQFCLLVYLVLYQQYQQHLWTYSTVDSQYYPPLLSAADYFPAGEQHLSSSH